MTQAPSKLARASAFIVACTLAALCASVAAQTPPAKAPTNTAAPAKAPKPTPAKVAPKAAVAPAKTLPAASAEQLAAAGIAHLGEYPCELGEAVSVHATPKHAGYLDVHHKKAVHTMKPVLSSTGALRLEDVSGRMLMLQIANKSMLMDVKLGQRVVDGCVHEMQRDAAAKPAGSSLGIEPSKP